MLQELSIKNFAIIDDLKINLSEGLTIISGETGAGKSIIINAVNLLLGSRATARLIRTGADSAELEAFFRIDKNSPLASTLDHHGFDPSEGLIIRRIITLNDRHKVYINGRMATIGLLTSITENLASISGQHAHQGLLKEEQHLLILDRFGGLIQLRNKVSACYHAIIPLIEDLTRIEASIRERQERRELLEFQQKEILDAALFPGEDIELEREKKRLKHAETLYQTVYDTIQTLYADQGAVVERLSGVNKSLEKACLMDPDLSGHSAGINEAALQLEDISTELGAYLSTVIVDEQRLETIEERLDLLNRLKRKYGGSTESILAHLETVDEAITGIENLSEKMTETESKLSEFHKKIQRLAGKLSEKRQQAALKLSIKVEKELTSLKMPGTRFEVSLLGLPETDRGTSWLESGGKPIQATGMDQATFMIAPNVGEALKPLTAIASGGELSRVILALKAILAETDSVETVVFDEVDAGIGGGVAEVVGRKLASLARHHQIICITHIAQIAKFAHYHLSISKSVFNGRTRTSITVLDKNNRLTEIARMLGGEKITPATLNHARELIG
jgi:DNA repair protein RecN (Recombination protein N)